MAKELVAFKKEDLKTVVATGDDKSVAITGLAEGTVVAAGDYKVAYRDSEGVLKDSTLVDVPAFTVKVTVEDTPTDVAAGATDSGANVIAA